MNSRSIFLILVCLAGVLYSTTYVTYNVDYLAHVTVDGNPDGWGSVQKQYLTAVPAGTQSKDYFQFAYKVLNPNTKEETDLLCGFFLVEDTINNAALDYLSIYNLASNDEHPMLKIGRNGRLYDVVGNTITNSAPIEYKKVESTGAWQGEFCVTFGYLGFTTASESIKNVVVRYENNNAAQSVWPFGIGNEGVFYSKDKWTVPAQPGCTSDSECKDTETCVDGSCKAVHTGACGYVADHKWNEYECCSSDTCPYGKTCVNNVCKSPDWCTMDKSCADDEYCAVAATGNKCLPVQGTCGYAANHKWNPYECCANADCAANKYCSGNTCKEVETKSCGQIVDHAWVSFECCADGGCAKGQSCVDNKCVEKTTVEPTSCSGKVGLDVYYYDKVNKLMGAEITGLKNCDGNVVFIRKDSCTGGAACAFNIGSNGNNCTFSIPNQAGVYKYVACVNIDGDTSYGPNETDSVIVEIAPEACKSTGCTATTYGQCVCGSGSTKGYKTGVCIDNCLNRIQSNMECSCGTPKVNETAPTPERPVVPPTKPATQPAVSAPPKVPIEYWQIAAVVLILAIPVLLHLLSKGEKEA